MNTITEQRYSIKGLNYLVEMMADDDWVRDNEVNGEHIKTLEALDKRYKCTKRVSTFGKQKITYKTPDTSAGKLGYGRHMGNYGSLERLHRPLRHTLCENLYHDIDVKNCQPTLLWQFAKMKYDYDLPEVIKYCENRDEYLATCGIVKDEAKIEILKSLFNGTVTHEILKPLKDEVLKFAIELAVRKEYADLLAVSKPDNPFGCYLALILQTEERSVMYAMKTALEKHKYSVDILAYDGVMVRKVAGNEPTDEILQDVIKIVKQKTKYDVELAIKPMKGFDLPADEPADCEVMPGVKMAEFMEMKVDFEKAHFYHNPTDMIGCYDDKTSKLWFISKDHAKNYFYGTKYHFKISEGSDELQFFDKWFKRSDRRSISFISYKETDDPLTFYHPIRFAFQTPSKINEEARGFFMDLIDITCNHNEVLKTYLLSYLAHLVQKPFEIPGTALVLTGSQGTGKDTLMNFVGNKVLGETNFADYPDNDQFFDRHDLGRAGKTLVKLQEANRHFCVKNADKLKAMITSSTMLYNPKGKNAYELPNNMRLVFTTNKENPFEIDSTERRYVMFAVSSEKQGNHDFWTNLHRAFNAEGAGYTVGDMLMRYDISTFNPAILPANDYFNAIVTVEESVEERFLKSDVWNGEEANIQHIFNLYREYAQNAQLPHKQTTISLSRALLKFVRDHKYISYREDRRHGQTGVYKKVP
jgi:hypothetical protein